MKKSKKRTRWLRLSFACNLVVVLSTNPSTNVGAAGNAGGINGVFGMTGVVAGEISRLTVANSAERVSETVASCQFELSFVDTNGRLLLHENGEEPYLKRVTIAPGSAESLDFVAPGNAVGVAHRLEVRPLVRQISPPLTPGCSPVANAVIVERNRRVIKVATPPDPCYPIPPTDASCPRSRYGPIVLNRGRTARFSAVAYPPESIASPGPIRIELSFVNENGVTIIGADGTPVITEVVLAPGGSGSLDLPATTTNGSAVRPMIRQIFPSSPIPVATSLEMLDSTSGAIEAAAYPMPLWAVLDAKRPTSRTSRPGISPLSSTAQKPN